MGGETMMSQWGCATRMGINALTLQIGQWSERGFLRTSVPLFAEPLGEETCRGYRVKKISFSSGAHVS